MAAPSRTPWLIFRLPGGDHGGDCFIAFAVDPTVSQDGRNPAIWAFDGLNRVPRSGSG